MRLQDRAEARGITMPGMP
jgi:hypothetical protein